MADIIGEYNAAARAAAEPGVINSAEWGVNEWCLPLRNARLGTTPEVHVAGAQPSTGANTADGGLCQVRIPVALQG